MIDLFLDDSETDETRLQKLFLNMDVAVEFKNFFISMINFLYSNTFTNITDACESSSCCCVNNIFKINLKIYSCLKKNKYICLKSFELLTSLNNRSNKLDYSNFQELTLIYAVDGYLKIKAFSNFVADYEDFPKLSKFIYLLLLGKTIHKYVANVNIVPNNIIIGDDSIKLFTSETGESKQFFNNYVTFSSFKQVEFIIRCIEKNKKKIDFNNIPISESVCKLLQIITTPQAIKYSQFLQHIQKYSDKFEPVNWSSINGVKKL